MEKQAEYLAQPTKRSSGPSRVAVVLLVIFGVVGVAGLSFGVYTYVATKNHMEAKHLKYREVDEEGNVDNVNAYVSPKEKRISREIDFEHRPGLRANSSTLVSDFEAGFRAFRTKGENPECFVTKIDQSFEAEVEEIETQDPSRKRRDVVMKDVIHTRVLRATAGDVIADHCQDVDAFWMVPATEEDKEGETTELATTSAPGERVKRGLCLWRRCYYWHLTGTWWYYRCYYYYASC